MRPPNTLQAMARRKAFPAPPYHTSIDAAVNKMNAVFDDVETLARTQIPLPYAPTPCHMRSRPAG